MRLLYFEDFRLGVLRTDDTIVDVSDAIDVPHVTPQGLIKFLIADFGRHREAIERVCAEATDTVPLKSVRLRAPIPKPSTMACMAVNYMEDGTREAPAALNAFLKPGSCVIGDGDAMILPDVAASVFEGEAELAVVIGRRAENVSAEDAMDYVFGYTNMIDGSARGLGPAKNSFYQMKARATFAALGPYLVTADEIADPQQLQVRQWSNGIVKQDFNTNDMAHNIARCIEWVSSVHRLEPGDVLATGTNHRGLFAYQDGDAIEMEVEGLGRLHIGIQDSLQRTWRRETRLEREREGLEPIAEQLTGKYS